MIEVRGLAKQLGRQEILRGVDMTVAKGETLVIIGRSGGGKSVLLKHLIGLMQPDAGEIWIEGENIIGLTERKLARIRRKVGILFQGGALFDSMTVEENIAFPLEEAGERLFSFTRLPPSQWRSVRTTNAIERLHEEFKRRIKTQTVLPSADTAAMLFWALLASGQINMRKVDGWQTLATAPTAQPIDLAA